jgi:hypothetical protein
MQALTAFTHDSTRSFHYYLEPVDDRAAAWKSEALPYNLRTLKSQVDIWLSTRSSSSMPMGLSQEDRLCECLLILTALLHVLVCPFVKVEETFNLHAIHDILTKGLSENAVARDVSTTPSA